MINYNALLDNLFDNIWEKRCPEYTFVGPSKGSMRQVLIQDEDKLEQLLKFGL